MTKMKLHDRVVRFLTKGLHMTEIESKSKKYRKFLGKHTNSPYYVGKNGAVRYGESTGKSFSLKPSVHRAMERWERNNEMEV